MSAETTCWSCERPRDTIPVMFPASPAHDAPLKRHWWCEECAEIWLGEGGEEGTMATTGAVEVAAERGYREVQG